MEIVMDRTAYWLPALALVTACAGNQNNIDKVYPIPAISPELLSFGDVAVDYSSTLDIAVINSGPVDLELSDFTIQEPFTLGDHETTVAPDEQITIPVTFLPSTYTSYTGALTIHTNGEDDAVLTAVLTGTGVDAPTPDIDVDPVLLDFGGVSPGTVGTKLFTIANVGDGSLNIASMEQADSGAFALTGDPTGFALAAGQSTTIGVYYSPTTSNGDHATVTIVSDDPDEPTTVVTLLGNGGGADFQYPVAVIDCPTEVTPRETVELDGSGSYDPDGSDLTYSWTAIEVPEGSQAALSGTTSDTAWFATDIAGEYAVQLSVTNSIGVLSSPTTCTFTAVPEEEIHVELTWSTPSADVDIHLVQPGGSFFINPTDCNWCNQSPDWGTTGSAQNPSLDIDDYIGYGPENVNDLSPADGTYAVKVHYFTDNGDSTLTATVKVYLYGVLEAEESRAMDRDDVWDAGQIQWPEGLYVEETTANYEAPIRGCE